MPKNLTNDHYSEINHWLEKRGIIVPINNMHRYFSDGVAVAKILKDMHPRLVNTNNYPSHSSTSLKMNNWETLNFKVLSKINLNLSKEKMEKFAKATPGAIEQFLLKIMQVEKNYLKKLQNEQEEQWMKNDDIMMIPLERTVGDTTVTQIEKMILYSIYEDVYRTVDFKEHLIKAEQRKLIHYENLLKLRNQRIAELHKQMEKPNTRAI